MVDLEQSKKSTIVDLEVRLNQKLDTDETRLWL